MYIYTVKLVITTTSLKPPLALTTTFRYPKAFPCIFYLD